MKEYKLTKQNENQSDMCKGCIFYDEMEMHCNKPDGLKCCESLTDKYIYTEDEKSLLKSLLKQAKAIDDEYCAYCKATGKTELPYFKLQMEFAQPIVIDIDSDNEIHFTDLNGDLYVLNTCSDIRDAINGLSYCRARLRDGWQLSGLKYKPE